MKIKFLLLSLLSFVLFYGCAITTYNINHDLTMDNLSALISKESPKYCSYRGKASVVFDGSQKISFTMLLNKKCNNDALINVLGALNSPVASIKYEDNKVEVNTQSKENTEEIKRVADNSIFHIISYFQPSHTIPDSTYKLFYTTSSYIFTSKSGTKIYVDDKFRIYKYKEGDIVSEYFWSKNNNFLESVKISSPSGEVTVKFLNKNGWSTKDAK